MKKAFLINSSILALLCACSNQPKYDVQTSQQGIDVTRTNSALNSACFGYSPTKETSLTGKSLLDISVEVDKVINGVSVVDATSAMSSDLYPQEFSLPVFTGNEGHVPNCNGIVIKTDIDKPIGSLVNDYSNLLLNYQLEFGNTKIIVPENYQNTTAVAMTAGDFKVVDGVGETKKYIHTDSGDYLVSIKSEPGVAFQYMNLQKEIERENLQIKSPFDSSLPDEKPGTTLQDVERSQSAPLSSNNELPITTPNKTPNITP
jgi:hypothetical protein